MSLRLLFKYATRSRPELFKRGIESIINNCHGYRGYSILVSADTDDPTMNNKEMIDWCRQFGQVLLRFGESKSKIDAVNRDMDLMGFDSCQIIVVMSDDMVFTEKGFDNVIRNQFYQGFDNGTNGDPRTINLDQCLHFPDQNQGENCMTMSIMGRDYYNRDKFIYNPEFESLWCDVVAQEVAQIRDCYKYVPIRIFDHLHPSFGQAVYDEQYRKTEDWGVRQRDYATYLKLKKEYDPTNIFPIRPI